MTQAGILVGMLEGDSDTIYEVHHRVNLCHGVRALLDGPFDVCLVDLTVHPSPTDAVGRIRGASPTLPIVALTTVRHAELRTGVLGCGAQDILVKGRFEREDLHRSMGNAMDRQRYLNHLVESQQTRPERNDEILDELAHDLRNPLAAVLGAVEMLDQDTATLDQEQRFLADVIARNGTRILELVEGLGSQRPEADRSAELGHWVTGVETARWIADGVVNSRQVDEAVSGLRVLVADDSLLNRQVTHALLERLGCSVLTVASGEAVIELVADECSCDVILVDLHMDGIGGVDVAVRLRRHHDQTWASVPLIAATGSVHPSQLQRCAEVGFTGHLAKPFTMEQLRNVVYAATAGVGAGMP